MFTELITFNADIGVSANRHKNAKDLEGAKIKIYERGDGSFSVAVKIEDYGQYAVLKPNNSFGHFCDTILEMIPRGTDERASCIPPANIGDNVYSILENPDCDDVNFIATTISDSGNVFSIFTFQVHGYAYIDGTWYLTDFDRELLEVGKDVYVSKTEAMEALRKLVKTSRNEESQ